MRHRAALVEPDEWLESDLLQSRGPLELRQRRAGRDEQHVGVAEELDRLVGPSDDRECPEREIELAAFDHLEKLALVLRLAEHDLHLRVALGEAPKEAGDDLGTDALERPDAKASGVPGLERAHVGLRREESRLNRVGVAEQDLAGFGEGDRAWAAGALDEPQPDDPLERCDLL